MDLTYGVDMSTRASNSSEPAPPITIGMPVYNGEPYLEEALDSILSQTFTEFILVVSDNGSTDGTQEIVRARARKDDRIRYHRELENRGAVWNFNRVFAESRSPFFKWAAADDTLAPACLERCYVVLKDAPPDVVLVASQAGYIGPTGESLSIADDEMNVMESTPHARLRHVVRNVLWGNAAFGLIRATALRQTRLFGPYPSNDWVLLAELALQGKLHAVPEPLYFRRDHDGTSRRANSEPLGLALWLDPKNEKPVRELPRVFVEFLRGTEYAPLPRSSKLRCQAAMVAAFGSRHAQIRARLAMRTRLRTLVKMGHSQ